MKIPAYYRKLLSLCFLLVGSFLMGEHIYNYGFDIGDLLGHETYGFVMIILAILISPHTIIKDPIKYAKEKLKRVFGNA